MTVYVIEERTDYMKGSPNCFRTAYDLGYYSDHAQAEDFVENHARAQFEEWARKEQRQHARELENFYYPEMRSKEEQLLFEIGGHLIVNFQEPDVSKMAYEESLSFRTWHVVQVEPALAL